MTHGSQALLKKSMLKAPAGRPDAHGDATVEAEARIVDQADGVVTVEVCCPCGQTILLQCFHAQPTPTAPAQG